LPSASQGIPIDPREGDETLASCTLLTSFGAQRDHACGGQRPGDEAAEAAEEEQEAARGARRRPRPSHSGLLLLLAACRCRISAAELEVNAAAGRAWLECGSS